MTIWGRSSLSPTDKDLIRFVIDRLSIIRAIDADPDYTRRSEPARTVEILAGLRATPSGKERA